MPRRLQELSAKVNQATDKLTNELQRSPKVEEIADYLGVTVDEVLEAMESSSAYTSVPIEAPGASDSDDAPSILDRYADDDNELAENTSDVIDYTTNENPYADLLMFLLAAGIVFLVVKFRRQIWGFIREIFAPLFKEPVREESAPFFDEVSSSGDAKYASRSFARTERELLKKYRRETDPAMKYREGYELFLMRLGRSAFPQLPTDTTTLHTDKGGKAFGGRVLDDSKPKYVNSPETLVYHKSETVFALQIAKRSAVRRFVLCEGYMDVISMHQAGIDTAVCACGTALTPGQVRLISEYADEVILSYDSDEAGQKATLRSLELFRNSPVKVGVLQIPGAKDPDEYIKKYGAERFKALLDGVGNALDFRLGRLRSQYDLAQDAQRLEYVKEAVNMLAERSNPTEQEVYAGRLAEETNISKTAIMTQLETAVKKAGNRRRWEKRQQVLKSGEMNQIKLPYSAGGSQALGIASAQQRLLAAILREPQYLKLAEKELLPEQFIQPQQKELYEAMLRCSREGIEINLTTLRAYVSEEALNELSRFAAQYSEVNCTPDDIRLYLDRIARGMPVAGKAAHMSNEELSDYLQSMREKKQGSVPVEE